jgi:hypothetical protein
MIYTPNENNFNIPAFLFLLRNISGMVRGRDSSVNIGYELYDRGSITVRFYLLQDVRTELSSTQTRLKRLLRTLPAEER